MPKKIEFLLWVIIIGLCAVWYSVGYDHGRKAELNRIMRVVDDFEREKGGSK